MSRKKKKKKYKPISFKLSDRQKRSLEAYCRRNNTTVNKFIKDSISIALKDGHKAASSGSAITKGQLDLEDLIEQVTRENQNEKSFKLPFPDDLAGE
ncbi:MAG TPA: hypothetical protein VJ939_04130 [Bacteroidales bacterium]|nr:hypothetical protein [Bacteroidales bacterium]